MWSLDTVYPLGTVSPTFPQLASAIAVICINDQTNVVHLSYFNFISGLLEGFCPLEPSQELKLSRPKQARSSQLLADETKSLTQ